MDDLIPIGEFSRRSGLSAKRLRTYAAGGLLVPAAVDSSSGYRYYSLEQRREAELVDALRGAGMPLAEIRVLLQQPSADLLDSWARRLENDSDGMGGAPGGRLASDLAIALMEVAFTGRSADELAAGVRAANRAIWEHAKADAKLAGMGTTLCAVGLIADGSLAVVNVGDSRVYLAHDGSLIQLTQDHSVTGDLVRRGELTEEQARHHPHRSVLTRALGVGPDVELDRAAYPAVAGDRLLLCSDGLFSEVSSEEIDASMNAAKDLQYTADQLVELALSRGGRDNVSVVIAEISSAV